MPAWRRMRLHRSRQKQIVPPLMSSILKSVSFGRVLCGDATSENCELQQKFADAPTRTSRPEGYSAPGGRPALRSTNSLARSFQRARRNWLGRFSANCSRPTDPCRRRCVYPVKVGTARVHSLIWQSSSSAAKTSVILVFSVWSRTASHLLGCTGSWRIYAQICPVIDYQSPPCSRPLPGAIASRRRSNIATRLNSLRLRVSSSRRTGYRLATMHLRRSLIVG